MVRITVDTVEEATAVRQALVSQAHKYNCNDDHCTHTECNMCIEEYYKDKVELYKREIVETPIPIVL